jgi:hypothetical protein
MTANNTAPDVLAAVGMLQHARAACAGLKPAGFPMTAQELEQRATIIATVVRTRRLLRALQSRPDDAQSPRRARPEAMRA